MLETALQMGSSPDVRNAVRFGFWGAEELGTLGSTNYISTLDVDQLKDIALYLNFDMLASPNPGYFTYDGDQSLPPDKDGGVPRVPEGSAGIERTLVAYLDGAGKPAEDTSFDGRSDYDGFTKPGSRPVDCFRRRGGYDRGAGSALGAVRPTSRSTRTTTRRPTPSTTSTAPRWTSRARASATQWRCTPRISADATGFRSATTAPGTPCPAHETPDRHGVRRRHAERCAPPRHRRRRRSRPSTWPAR